jgi:hypothetical protein
MMNKAGIAIAEILNDLKSQAVIHESIFIPLYEYNLNVFIYNNEEAMKRQLLEWDVDEELVESIDYYNQGHFISCEEENIGHIIFFKSVMFDTLIHEVVHATQEVLRRAGYYADSIQSSALNESEAYLTGWLAGELFYMLAHLIEFKEHRNQTLDIKHTPQMPCSLTDRTCSILVQCP